MFGSNQVQRISFFRATLILRLNILIGGFIAHFFGLKFNLGIKLGGKSDPIKLT